MEEDDTYTMRCLSFSINWPIGSQIDYSAKYKLELTIIRIGQNKLYRDMY